MSSPISRSFVNKVDGSWRVHRFPKEMIAAGFKIYDNKKPAEAVWWFEQPFADKYIQNKRIRRNNKDTQTHPLFIA